MKNARLITYKGKLWTLKELSDYSGLNNKTLHARLKGKTEATDYDIRKQRKKKGSPELDVQLTSSALILSDLWLRSELTSKPV